MYYPYLRGRQNELLAIKDLLSEGRLSDKVIPIIEPVKLSPTLVNTLDLFNQKQHPIVLIWNPQVGAFADDANNTKNQKYLDKLKGVLSVENIIRGIIINNDTSEMVSRWRQRGISDNQIISICINPDSVKYYEETFSSPVKTVLPYSSSFRRIRADRILLEDKFNKKSKNSDYQDMPDEFFSFDHRYFSEEGFVGFSDYSVIGEEYSETGFAPFAVTIHIVYFDSDKNLRIHHFVSDDNDDISDPANKFYQALSHLVEWNKITQINTKAINEFKRIYDEQSYPGLGVVKKISLMNHLELVGMFLDGKI